MESIYRILNNVGQVENKIADLNCLSAINLTEQL